MTGLSTQGLDLVTQAADLSTQGPNQSIQILDLSTQGLELSPKGLNLHVSTQGSDLPNHLHSFDEAELKLSGAHAGQEYFHWALSALHIAHTTT